MTFALTVVADLTVAVEVGMVLAALLYIHRVSQTTTVSSAQRTSESKKPLIWAGWATGALGTVVILRLRNLTAPDATGLHTLEGLAGRLRGWSRR